ncbi:KCNJN [Lepeophtheirus salmonis]|uniref:KCNJN n=1 Tax=Lepeophtheirus salmonis TaxID=72036 RepID=A0A7R8D0E2_LEPSM|nr:KCNJN [Lepeophtheirus salmonis]CAF2957859.1 KCNJN [Lepeophtheirus salmonis]
MQTRKSGAELRIKISLIYRNNSNNLNNTNKSTAANHKSAERKSIGNPTSFDDEESDDMDEESASKTPFYITVETLEGALEQVPVEVDASNFSANKPILTYLADVGEISPPKKEKNEVSTPLSLASNEDLEKELEKRAREVRSDSIVTPNLIASLKSNKRRLVSKNGQCNIELKRVPKKNMKLIKDIFTTAVDMRWRYTLFFFATSFFVSWLLFALIWWAIAFGHGDLEWKNLPDFTSCFLFSIETQHTIGYGSRSTSEECPIAIIVMCLQSIIGVVISACMAGIVFAKLARPKLRSNTILYSKNAVITMRNDELYLLFRVGNMRKSHLIEAHLRAQLVYDRSFTDEGENMHYKHEELSICTQADWNSEDRTLIIWPIIIAHKIDEESPFFSMSPKDILSSRFEIIVSLEGVVEPTGELSSSIIFLPP